MTKETDNLIHSLVMRGYKEAAFRKKSNALKFKRLWENKGYEVEHVTSSGPVVEGGYSRRSYYMIAHKKRTSNRAFSVFHPGEI